MVEKPLWEPQTIPQMVDEMLVEAYRLCGGDKDLAVKMMMWLADKDPLIKQALALWYLDRHPGETGG